MHTVVVLCEYELLWICELQLEFLKQSVFPNIGAQLSHTGCTLIRDVQVWLVLPLEMTNSLIWWVKKSWTELSDIS